MRGHAIQRMAIMQFGGAKDVRTQRNWLAQLGPARRRRCHPRSRDRHRRHPGYQ